MAKNDSWWSPTNSPEPEVRSGDLEFTPMETETLQQEQSDELLTRRIHIVGMGSIGTLVAHSLKCLPNPPPITLLFHRPELYEDFNRGHRMIRLVNKKTGINDEQTGYDVDIREGPTNNPVWRYVPDTPDEGARELSNPRGDAEVMENDETFIYTLIVTVKGPHTIETLKNVKHRVDARTTILLMQNGMGQIDELNRKVFTNVSTRPTYMLGIISHGAYMTGRFNVVHAGFGTVALGVYRDTDKYPLPPRNRATNVSELSEEERKKYFPTDEELYSNLSSRYLLRTLTRCPVLACAAFPYLDLFQLQLEKLVMNSVLNPVTALLDIQNGFVLDNEPLSRVHRLLIAETSLVLRGLPELEGIPNVRTRFSSRRLEELLISIANKTALNSSSMREDVRHQKDTEIEYINGYIVRRGEEQGIKCVLNYMIMQLIRGKTAYQTGMGSRSTPYGVSNIQAEYSSKTFGESEKGVTLEDKGTRQA